MVKQLATDLGLTHRALYRLLARTEADGEIKRGATIRGQASAVNVEYAVFVA